MNNPRTALPAAFLLDLHHPSSPPPDSSVTLPRLHGSMSGFGAFSIKGGRPRAGPKASPLQRAFQDSDDEAEEMPQAAAGAEELQVGVAMMRAGFLQGPSGLAFREKEWARQGCKGLGCAHDAGATSTALAASRSWATRRRRASSGGWRCGGGTRPSRRTQPMLTCCTSKKPRCGARWRAAAAARGSNQERRSVGCTCCWGRVQSGQSFLRSKPLLHTLIGRGAPLPALPCSRPMLAPPAYSLPSFSRYAFESRVLAWAITALACQLSLAHYHFAHIPHVLPHPPPNHTQNPSPTPPRRCSWRLGTRGEQSRAPPPPRSCSLAGPRAISPSPGRSSTLGRWSWPFNPWRRCCACSPGTRRRPRRLPRCACWCCSGGGRRRWAEARTAARVAGARRAGEGAAAGDCGWWAPASSHQPSERQLHTAWLSRPHAPEGGS